MPLILAVIKGDNGEEKEVDIRDILRVRKGESGEGDKLGDQKKDRGKEEGE